jgi:hypothetical protein
MRKALLIAIATVVVANAATLTMVAINRGGEEARLVLTERELRLAAPGTENTGISLGLTWRRPWDQFKWFDRAKLEAVGYDCSIDPDDPAAEAHYLRARFMQRAAYLALEYRPEEIPTRPPGEAIRETAALRERPELDTRRSRLVAIDADIDRAALRARHPDRHRVIIAPASVYLLYEKATDTHPARLRGGVNMVFPSEVCVPKEHRVLLEQIMAGADPQDNPRFRLDHDPRYEVTLVYGSRLEPRITNVVPLENGDGGK